MFLKGGGRRRNFFVDFRRRTSGDRSSSSSSSRTAPFSRGEASVARACGGWRTSGEFSRPLVRHAPVRHPFSTTDET